MTTPTAPPPIPPANAVHCFDCWTYYPDELALECPEAPFDPDAGDNVDRGHEGIEAVYLTHQPLGRPEDDDVRIAGRGGNPDRWAYPSEFPPR